MIQPALRVVQRVENCQIAFAGHTEALGRAERDQAFDKKAAAVADHVFDILGLAASGAGRGEEVAVGMDVQAELVAVLRRHAQEPAGDPLAASVGERRVGEGVGPDEVRDDQCRVICVQPILPLELVVAVIAGVPVVRHRDVERMAAMEVEPRE